MIDKIETLEVNGIPYGSLYSLNEDENEICVTVYHPLHFQNSGLWSGGVESVLKSC